MKIMLVYSSRTGNTKKIAKAILEVLPENTESYPVEEAPLPDRYDALLLGFWVDKSQADERSRQYMANVKNKNICLFATLGAEPDSEHAADVMAKTRKLLQGNTILGEFVCQGKIDPGLIKIMEASGAHPMTPERMKRHEEAKKHPNEEDCRNAQKAFQGIFKGP